MSDIYVEDGGGCLELWDGDRRLYTRSFDEIYGMELHDIAAILTRRGVRGKEFTEILQEAEDLLMEWI